MANTYPRWIGLTTGTLAKLSTLNVPEPDIVPVQYSKYLELGDGTIRGSGWLRCEWRWAHIEVDEVRVLQLYCPGVTSTVYIKTVKSAASMEVYQATMVWPQTEQAEINDCYEDFVIEFRKLTVAAT